MEDQTPKNIRSALWQDGQKVYGGIGPSLSLLYWVCIWLGREAPTVKDFHFAWGFLPLLIWVSICYWNRWRDYKKIVEQITPKIEFTRIYEEPTRDNTGNEYAISFYIGVKNKSVSDNLSNCLVQLSNVLIENDNHPILPFQLPARLRTIRQMERQLAGRFNLDGEMEKKIFLFMRVRSCDNEWLFKTAENDNFHTIIINNGKVEISCFGGPRVDQTITINSSTDNPVSLCPEENT